MLMGSLVRLRYDLTMSFGPMDGDFIVRSMREIATRVRERDEAGAIDTLSRYMEEVHRKWVSGDYQGSRLARED
jgi:hypothetical protein